MRLRFACLLPLVVGCSAAGAAGGSGDGSGGADPGSGGGFNNSGGFTNTGGASPGTGGGFIVGTGGTSPGDQDGGCTGVVEQAEKSVGGEADIIWAIDNSGSMFDEAAAVTNNMNFFSEFISGTGIDVRVVVVSSGPGLFGLAPPYGVCIAPPLGSGGPCPDTSTYPNGNYLHIVKEVDSHNALGKLQETYPQWEPVIRPTSTKTFVVVTDDEASAIPGAQGFYDWVNSLPKFQGSLWRFSGIYCLPGGAAGFNCSGTGHTYHDLATRTGGVSSDMGNPDWTAIFQQLADAVVADAVPVECEWVIPPPPPGETLDPNLVNVKFTRGTGVTETIYGVSSSGQCTQDFLGWYYDDAAAPTRVIACPQTCPVLQSDDQARIEVQFGCERERPPIE